MAFVLAICVCYASCSVAISLIGKESVGLTAVFVFLFSQTQNVALLGQSNERLPQVLQVFCQVVADKLADAPTLAKMSTMVAPMKSAVSPQVLQQLLQSTDSKYQAKVKAVLGL